MAQLTLLGYRNELKSRGYDGIIDADLTRYVNWGYFHVALKARWAWEESDTTFTLAAGAFRQALPVTFSSLRFLTISTAGQQRKLSPMAEEEFVESWLPLDLTAVANRGEPSTYFIYHGFMYILSPPVASRDFVAAIWQRPVALSADGDVPLTPEHFDEGILIAAEIRCARRKKRFDDMGVLVAQLLEFFDLGLSENTERMDEEQEQVVPDRGWL